MLHHPQIQQKHTMKTLLLANNNHHFHNQYSMSYNNMTSNSSSPNSMMTLEPCVRCEPPTPSKIFIARKPFILNSSKLSPPSPRVGLYPKRLTTPSSPSMSPLPSFKQMELQHQQISVYHTVHSTTSSHSQALPSFSVVTARALHQKKKFEKPSELSIKPSFDPTKRAKPISIEQSLSRISKPQKQRNNRHNQGRWTDEEHELFLKGFQICGRDWSRISREFVTTRMRSQVASHAQKYLARLEQEQEH